MTDYARASKIKEARDIIEESLTPTEIEAARKAPTLEQMTAAGDLRDEATAWRQERKTRGALLVGAVGTGKSRAAHATIVYGADSGYRPCYIDMPVATQQIRANHGPTIADFTAAAMQADVVVLDDIGATDGQDVKNLAAAVLHAAWRASALIVITSNMGKARLGAWFEDPRVISKLGPLREIKFGTDIPDHRGGEA